MAFSDIFPLVCDDRSKPYGWSWMADGSVMDIPQAQKVSKCCLKQL
ncbi:MAG: hypothetical protein Q9M16_07445 [Mariprofundus sp.]|nr:hypothetical protein [Mariprofundus sp.]